MIDAGTVLVSSFFHARTVHLDMLTSFLIVSKKKGGGAQSRDKLLVMTMRLQVD